MTSLVRSRVRSFRAFLFNETQAQPNEKLVDNVITILAITGATLLGGLVGNGHIVTYVPYFNIELEYSGWKSFLLSAVAAIATIIGMKIPLVSTWIPLRFLVAVFIGISLGTNVGMVIGQLQMEIVVFIASGVSLVTTTAVLLLQEIAMYVFE